jgi:membrane-associated phospholipid phosphatase
MTARIAEIANRITVVAAVLWVVVIALIITARLQLGVDHTLVDILTNFGVGLTAIAFVGAVIYVVSLALSTTAGKS